MAEAGGPAAAEDEPAAEEDEPAAEEDEPASLSRMRAGGGACGRSASGGGVGCVAASHSA